MLPPPADDPAAEMQSQGRALRALARSILRSTTDAEDVVQEAFATELTSRSARHNRPGWLTRIVQNLARRRLRDRARRQRHDQTLPAPSPAPAADDVVAEIETHRMVAEAVLELPHAYRRAVVLRYWHDLPPRAISRQLGIPVATVKTHLQRGLAELRQRLDQQAGDRTTWLMALVPIAHPQLLSGVAAGSPFALTTATALTIMNAKQLLFVVVACLCLGMFVWQPWQPTTAGQDRPATNAGLEPQHAARVDDTAQADVDRAVAAAVGDTGATERTPAAPDGPVCTVVGRIVTTGGLPAANARLRLVNRWQASRAPSRTATTDDDGGFRLTVPKPGPWIPYEFALADATGWAVHEIELAADVQQLIADDHLDLGTLELERGVAVAGRVVEADGSPLRSRARLLAWDPSRRGSWTAMYRGRTVGFAEPGGAFELADRMSAGKNAVRMLAAVSASGVGWASLAFAAGQEHLDPVEIRLLPGGGVEVQVEDEQGVPVAAATVQAVPYFQPIGLPPMWQPAADRTPPMAEAEALFMRRSDAEGRATFVHLPRRQHESVRDANMDQRPVKAIILSTAKEGYITDHTTVDPGADAPARVTVILKRQRFVSFAGVVATPDGTPLPGIEVRYLGGGQPAVTDADGRYELSDRPVHSDGASFQLGGGDVPMTRARADIPPTGDRVEHDFVVELRAPVTGRVVDQFGEPIAGVALHLGIQDGMHYKSTPERTGADGRFAFPDAVGSHDDLWLRPPEPRTAWQLERSRRLTRRDDETVILQRLTGPFVDLTLAIVAGGNGAAISPTEVDLRRLHGNSPDYDTPQLEVELALGTATARNLLPGRYRATVRAADGLRTEQEFIVPEQPATHTERIELWPPSAVVCTVDPSALPAAMRASQTRTQLVVLDPDSEESYLVDAHGKRLNYTPNTGKFRIGDETSFRLERVTANVPLRLRVLGQDLFGEVWFRAEPGQDAHVTLPLVPAGKLQFVIPADWPSGTIEVDTHDGTTWRPLDDWRHEQQPTPEERTVRRPTGQARWRLRLWPGNDAPMIERIGATEVTTDQTSRAQLD